MALAQARSGGLALGVEIVRFLAALVDEVLGKPQVPPVMRHAV